MAKALKLAINVILGEETATAAEIANALRAQADALDGAGKAAPAKKASKTKAAKKEDEDGDSDGDDSDSQEDASDDSNSVDDDEGDATEESETEEGEEDEDDAEEEAEKGPSKAEVLATLKLVAAKKKISVAKGVMKKVTGKDSIHDVKSKDYAKLQKALKLALKS